MPCFKGLAVSIHTPDGPLPEYSVQRQSRASRIACYIPVPPPKIPDPATGKAEQSTFAISITLLTPGLKVPYSTPKPTPENPNPKPKVVGGLPGQPNSGGSISPYQPITASPNETVAAYIYFDGRQKEEVATLLRRGEETWVNSRWVAVPESEGGGLAEREFLFREVGLERWLNGLDLEGKDAEEKVEKRRQKMERRRRKREAAAARAVKDGDSGMDIDEGRKPQRRSDVLRYGDNAQSPVENLSDDDYSDSDSEDDDPIPETAGQIKVALFRVLASGEVKRGEYSPQFDAHDDDDDSQGGQNTGDADVDHTTSFAKPKTLDPKSISTQTVTGIDPSDRPYAVFTFMYRGERQLQKMGILKSSKSLDKDKVTPAKRKSIQPDFSNLGPLKPGNAAGFLNFRDGKKSSKSSKRSKASGSDIESDDEDDDARSILGKVEDEVEKEINTHLSPDELRQQRELAEGVRQIKLKRQHSAEALSAMSGNVDTARTPQSSTSTARSTPAAGQGASTPPPGKDSLKKGTTIDTLDADAFLGSPLKKQRASVSGPDDETLRRRMGSQLSSGIQEIMGSSATANNNTGVNDTIISDAKRTEEMEEEL
ncbi:hypothetical protein VTO42DRAFT_2003 [Malbranchea cinnamomea]